MEIFDLHTHTLPGVDDGARNLEEALQMLRNAAASDVTHLVVTPHYSNTLFPPLSPQALQQRFAALQAAARDIPVRLYPGAEVHITNDLPADPLPTLNNSRYLLTEFHRELPSAQCTGLLKQLLQRGYIPIVAHPERYTCICHDPARAEQWLELGCHLQLTAGSILGKFGKAPLVAARSLLQADLVACVASDAHSPALRTNFLAEVYNHLHLHFSPLYARILLWENPLRICNDQPLTEE